MPWSKTTKNGTKRRGTMGQAHNNTLTSLGLPCTPLLPDAEVLPCYRMAYQFVDTFFIFKAQITVWLLSHFLSKIPGCTAEVSAFVHSEGVVFLPIYIFFF